MAPAAEPILGVIEGFYGRPWSWDARERMLAFMAQHGFNMYVYAPKDDPPHRRRWREDHSPAAMKRFRRIVQLSDEAGVTFVYGLSPIRLRAADGAGRAIVWRKLRAQQDLGVRGFGLLFDDLPEDLPAGLDERAEAARRQAALANEMLARLREQQPDAFLQTTPTEYHREAGSAYLRTLGQELDAAIDVLWTGPQVCSRAITRADIEPITVSLRRRPLIWDNYPVNDGDMRFDPHLRPLRGRSGDLPGAVRGLVANGAGGSEASMVALHTLAAYWSDPGGYEPERAWTAALREVATDRCDAEALGVLGQLASRSALEPDAPHRSIAPGVLATEVPRLREVSQRLLTGMANPWLARDIAPWARKLSSWVAAAEAGHAYRELVRRGADPPALGGARQLVRERRQVARKTAYRVADERFEELISWLLDAPAGASLPVDLAP